MSEKFSDPIDAAAASAQHSNDVAEQQRQIAERRRLLEYQRHLDDGDIDGVHCMDCDIELPTLRQQEKRLRCTACQTTHEKKGKR